ncbi:non-hydrolyzing UDP-N-acetylglucosamine 2-epimerase [Eubacterium limosum]|uniref:non-hydrolyzing UDP-N-acetylglucosamine 2-epimerase n=1 Tax=Eubacterium limosum TaxID=1736 RepID=UPI00106326DA|nr:UDP-N-acetylglucosamine 2-epimerase (non-hydrolyzing) [Eubacterium limosum]
MKVLTVVGARPQFIKAAVVSRHLRKTTEEIIVHTGQHYDYNMSEIFFEELNIPKPNYNLGISGGSHGEMTGKMLISIEKVLKVEKPDKLLVYGDTNSTLAAALAAVKLDIPVYHVEAGNRLGTFSNPEEINRICTDHVATVLMSCTESAVKFLESEGLSSRTHLVGDPMYDAFLYYKGKAAEKDMYKFTDLNGNTFLCPDDFYYLTCHRQENTSTDKKLTEILKAMNSLDAPTIYPVHPRNHDIAFQICQTNTFKNILLTQPVGYLTSLSLVNRAKKIVTDSGGLQREAFFAEKKCVTVFDHVVWPETMIENRNQLAAPCYEDILAKLETDQRIDPMYKPFGDGHAGEKIGAFLQ